MLSFQSATSFWNDHAQENIFYIRETLPMEPPTKLRSLRIRDVAGFFWGPTFCEGTTSKHNIFIDSNSFCVSNPFKPIEKDNSPNIWCTWCGLLLLSLLLFFSISPRTSHLVQSRTHGGIHFLVKKTLSGQQKVHMDIVEQTGWK